MPDASDATCDFVPGDEREACALGRELFHSPALSSDGRAACISCHVPDSGFSDRRARPLLRGRALSTPRTPSLLDAGRQGGPFSWNGRARTLVAQVFWPLHAKEEIDAPESTLDRHGGALEVARALATYVSSLRTPRAPFDAYVDGDCAALAPAEIRGARVFFGRVRPVSGSTAAAPVSASTAGAPPGRAGAPGTSCTACHAGPEFRGASTSRLRYFGVPPHAFPRGELSYSADVGLAQGRNASHVTLGSVPQTVRNLAFRGPPYGRFGQRAGLVGFLVAHARSPEEARLRRDLHPREARELASFLLIGLRSRSVEEAADASR